MGADDGGKVGGANNAETYQRTRQNLSAWPDHFDF